jgi:hypothetical protein
MTVEKIENLDIQPNSFTQSLKATVVNPAVVSINGGSNKATFRQQFPLEKSEPTEF